MPGKIKKIGYEKKGLGNYIKISHGEFEVTYGHLHTVLGEEGDFIEAGERVGISGNTGKVLESICILLLNSKENT